MSNKYYIKINGEVHKVSKEKYVLLKKELKGEDRKHLCGRCRISNCNKIVYRNINNCPEVEDAAYTLSEEEIQLVDGTIKKRYVVSEFLVFDCNKYEICKELRNNTSNEITSFQKTKEKLIKLQRELNEKEQQEKDSEASIKAKLEQASRDNQYKKILEYQKNREN